METNTMTQRQKNDLLIVAAVMLAVLFGIKAFLVPVFSKASAFASNVNTVVEDRAHKVNELPKNPVTGYHYDTIKPTK